MRRSPVIADGGSAVDANTKPSRVPSMTCVTCRARKVRCDGQKETCTNCRRLGFACSYAGHPRGDGNERHGPLPADVIVPRRRVGRACLGCHSRKAKCSGTRPKCGRCQAQGIDCEYTPARRTRPVDDGDVPRERPTGRRDSDLSRSPSSDHASRDDRLASITSRTLDNFFQHVHHIPTFTFLHRASLMQRYHAGRLDRTLLLALVGITALLTDLGPGTAEYGEHCAAEAEDLILGSLGKMSTVRLQALVLLVEHRILSQRFSAGFMLFSLASRLASALRLNHEQPGLCFLAQESRRRLMWTLYVMDACIAAGNADFGLWRPESIHIQLPCCERNFDFDLPEVTEPLTPPCGPDGLLPPLPDVVGLLALHVRVHLVRSRVLLFNRSAATRASAADLTALPVRCAELAADLDTFAARLPTSFRWSDGNLRLRAYSPRLYVFFLMHVWWEQSYCDIYRTVLPGAAEAIPRTAVQRLEAQHPGFVGYCRGQAVGHARALADMFGLVLTLENGIPIMGLEPAVCVRHCVRMLFYALETGPGQDGIDVRSVTESVKACLGLLGRCAPVPAVQVIVRPFPTEVRCGMADSNSDTMSRRWSGVTCRPSCRDVRRLRLHRDALGTSQSRYSEKPRTIH